MVKPIELKKGSIILYEGKSYLILDPPFSWNRTTENCEEPEQITSEVILVKCRYCEGNLFKRGTKKGQYLCPECNRPNWLDNNGNHEGA